MNKKYHFEIGNGGLKIQQNFLGISYPDMWPAEDGNIQQELPFVSRPLATDIPEEEQNKFVRREIKEINNQLFSFYYGKYFTDQQCAEFDRGIGTRFYLNSAEIKEIISAYRLINDKGLLFVSELAIKKEKEIVFPNRGETFFNILDSSNEICFIFYFS